MQQLMKRLMWWVGILIFAASALQAAVFKPEQINTLALVKEIALRYPDKNNETFAKTAMAICQTETSSGVFKVGDIGKDPNIFKASLGVMQVRLQTARFVAQKLDLQEIKSMSDVKLVNKLLSDDRFNIEVAVQFIVWLSNNTNHDYFRTVSRYNGGNSNHAYYNRVMRNMKLIQKETNLMDDLE
jgi:hypothetical protein